MDKIKTKETFKKALNKAGDAAKGIADKTVKAADLNENGTVDREDMVQIANNFGNTVKKGAEKIAEGASETKQHFDYNLYRPIYVEDIQDPEFALDKFIRVTERSKLYAKNGMYEDAIACNPRIKMNRVLTIFTDSLECFGIELLPYDDGEFYYVNPVNKNQYIALDEYFGYIKKATVGELQRIAQCLGAKEFTVTFLEEKATFSVKEKKVNDKVKHGVNIEKDRDESLHEKAFIEAQMSFPGHEPSEPELVFLKNEPAIVDLIKMRLHESNPAKQQTIKIELSKTSRIKEKEAIKIDTILKGLKCTGNTTVESETKNELRRSLRYDIEF